MLEPNQINTISIPVRSRSNGIFPVDVELRTPAGGLIGEPVELTARVSTLTGLGRVATFGAVIVLATWWFSYFRRRRTADRMASTGRHPTNGARRSDPSEPDDPDR